MAKIKNNTKYNHSAAVARHFGFKINENLVVKKETAGIALAAKKYPKYIANDLPHIEELSQILLNYREFEKERGPVPQLLYFDKPATGPQPTHRKKLGDEQISLHIIGVEDSIAEAILIKAISIMLSEGGYKKHFLLLNNVGCKETKTLFNREMTAFFRKHINLLNADCRQLLKDSVHSLITEGGSQCKVLKEHAPEPMDFLNETTREGFAKLIERIETFEIPYEINSDILGDINYSNFTNFKFVDDKGKVLAAGSRYNLLSKRIGLRKEIPAISANVWIKKSKTITSSTINKISNTKNFILQLGELSKTFTLKVLTDMWNNKVYSKHNLVKDRLTPQIQESMKEESENIIIIGQKEALDFNVMVRDAGGRSQKILTVEELIKFLKQ